MNKRKALIRLVPEMEIPSLHPQGRYCHWKTPSTQRAAQEIKQKREFITQTLLTHSKEEHMNFTCGSYTEKKQSFKCNLYYIDMMHMEEAA